MNSPDAVLQLEASLDKATEILARWPMYPTGDGLERLIARGTPARSNYVRPMFQVMDDGSPGAGHRSIPCQRCADVSRSWNCPDHQSLAGEESVTVSF